jgi:hypothetical protein
MTQFSAARHALLVVPVPQRVRRMAARHGLACEESGVILKSALAGSA